VIRCVTGDCTVVWIDVLSLCLNSIASTDNKLSPRGRRDDMSPHADGSSTVGGKNRGGSTSVRGRVRSPHISGGWRRVVHGLG